MNPSSATSTTTFTSFGAEALGLARELVELETRLREHTDEDPFLPVEESGISSFPECVALKARLSPSSRWSSDEVMRLCLQVLRIQHDQLRTRLLDAELVATLPQGTPGLARPTESVVREMVNSATKEVILLGYEFTDSKTVELLAQAGARGVDVLVICDRGRGVAARIRESWPDGCQAPRLFHDRERSDGAHFASMHAKCLLVDNDDLLVTSANFTFHGLHGNIEIGVRLTGALAGEARKIFSHLVEARLVVEEDNQ